MSARIALPTLILAALAALPRPADAGPWGLAHGEWYSNFEGSAFSAHTFHLASGFRADTGLVVEQRALSSTSEIGWKHRITLVFSLPALSVTRRDAGLQGTATGFQDVQLGARWNLINGPTAAALEIDWSAPAGYNRHLDSLGYHLGDGLQELSGGLALGTGVLGRGFLQGSLGYGRRYLGIAERAKGPVVAGDPHPAKYLWADHLLASADLGLWVRPSLLVGGRYRGQLSLSSGAMVQETDAHLAGAVLLYRVDDRLDVFAGSWSTVSGKNTLHIDEGYVGMAFHKTTLHRLQGFLGSKPSP
jgi:hypothetical protein